MSEQQLFFLLIINEEEEGENIGRVAIYREKIGKCSSIGISIKPVIFLVRLFLQSTQFNIDDLDQIVTDAACVLAISHTHS